MIVRCGHCSSAFSVDDSKVADKQFAFTCPKCFTENVFDNRDSAKHDITDELPQNETFDDSAAEPSYEETLESESIVQAEDLGAQNEVAGAASLEPDTIEELDGFELEPVSDPGDSDDDIISTEEFPIFDNEETAPLSGGADGEDSAEGVSADNDAFSLFEDDDTPLIEIGDVSGENVSLGDTEFPVFDDDDVVPLTSENDEKKEESSEDAAGDSAFPIFDEDAFSLTDADDTAGAISIDDIGDIEFPVFEGDDVVPLTDEDYKVEDGGSAATEAADDSTFPIFDEDAFSLSDADDAPEGEAADKEFPIFADEEISSPITDVDDDDDESITIDLDSLNIDLAGQDSPPASGPITEEIPFEAIDIDIPELSSTGKIAANAKDDEDESITLDLDSLDIPIIESDELHSGIVPDDDEKLTLDDAGLTLDDLTEDQKNAEHAVDDERLTINDMNPNLKVDDLEDELREVEGILSPDDVAVDDQKAAAFNKSHDDEAAKVKPHVAVFTDDTAPSSAASYDYNDDFEDDIDFVAVSSPAPVSLKGFISFFVDYSLKYSRLFAFLRLTGIFYVALIPHIIVFGLYFILSVVLGFMNQLIVLTMGKDVRDFSEIIEKTLRYFLSIKTVGIAVIDDMPTFAGKKEVNHSLQMKIVYPARFSRVWSALRLSIVGMLIALLPHLLILCIMFCLLPVMFLMGLICVIVTSRWPYMLFELVTGYYRYFSRVAAFALGLVDQYPPFKF